MTNKSSQVGSTGTSLRMGLLRFNANMPIRVILHWSIKYVCQDIKTVAENNNSAIAELNMTKILKMVMKIKWPQENTFRFMKNLKTETKKLSSPDGRAFMS